MASIIIITIVVLSVLLIALLALQAHNATVNRREMNASYELNTARAGNEEANTPQTVSVTGEALAELSFPGDKNRKVHSTDCFVALGNSMLLRGIQDHDVVLTEHIHDNLHEAMPGIFVIKRGNSKECATDNSRFKLRHAVACCDLANDNPLDIVRSCINSNDFIALKAKNKELFNTDFIEDFKKRLDKFEKRYPECKKQNNQQAQVVISTTLDTKKGSVHFSIHPQSSIVAKVVRAYHKA